MKEEGNFFIAEKPRMQEAAERGTRGAPLLIENFENFSKFSISCHFIKCVENFENFHNFENFQ